MSETIQADAFDFLKKLISSFSNFLDKSIDWLEKVGVDIDDPKEVKDDEGKSIGTMFTAVTGEGHKVRVKVIEVEGTNSLFDVYLVGDNGTKKSYKHTTEDAFIDKITDFVDDAYGEDLNEEDVEDINVDEEFEASTNVNCTTKVQLNVYKDPSTNEIVVNKIFANYDPVKAYEDIEVIFSEPEFFDSVSEEPTSYEIIPQEDDLILNEIDNVQEMGEYQCIFPLLEKAYIALFSVEMLKLNYIAQNLEGDRHFCHLRDIFWDLKDEIEVLPKLFIEDSVIDLYQVLRNAVNALPEDTNESIERVESAVEDYCMTLDLFYPNFPHEIQDMFDSWLRNLRYDL